MRFWPNKSRLILYKSRRFLAFTPALLAIVPTSSWVGSPSLVLPSPSPATSPPWVSCPRTSSLTWGLSPTSNGAAPCSLVASVLNFEVKKSVICLSLKSSLSLPLNNDPASIALILRFINGSSIKLPLRSVRRCIVLPSLDSILWMLPNSYLSKTANPSLTTTISLPKYSPKNSLFCSGVFLIISKT